MTILHYFEKSDLCTLDSSIFTPKKLQSGGACVHVYKNIYIDKFKAQEFHTHNFINIRYSTV